MYPGVAETKCLIFNLWTFETLTLCKHPPAQCTCCLALMFESGQTDESTRFKLGTSKLCHMLCLYVHHVCFSNYCVFLYVYVLPRAMYWSGFPFGLWSHTPTHFILTPVAPPSGSLFSIMSKCTSAVCHWRSQTVCLWEILLYEFSDHHNVTGIYAKSCSLTP